MVVAMLVNRLLQTPEMRCSNLVIANRAENTHRCGKDHCTACLRLNNTGPTMKICFFVCCETAESKLVNLESSRTVILPPTVSVIWLGQNEFYSIAPLSSSISRTISNWTFGSFGHFSNENLDSR